MTADILEKKTIQSEIQNDRRCFYDFRYHQRMTVRALKQRYLLNISFFHFFLQQFVRCCRQIQQLSAAGVHRDLIQDLVSAIRKCIHLIHDQKIKTTRVSVQLMHRANDQICKNIFRMSFANRPYFYRRECFLQTLCDLQYDLTPRYRKTDSFPVS